MYFLIKGAFSAKLKSYKHWNFLWFFAGMTDTITIVNYRNVTTHYHYCYRYFQNTDSRLLVDFKLSCRLICFK